MRPVNPKLKYSKHDVQRIQKNLAPLYNQTSNAMCQAFVRCMNRLIGST